MTTLEALPAMTANLKYTRSVLERLGCERITPIVLATAEFGRPVESDMMSAADRQTFNALYLAACELLGVAPHAPDTKPARERTADELEALIEVAVWSARAQQAMAADVLARMDCGGMQ